MKRFKAFTVIEMLITVTTISILVLIFLPRLFYFIEYSKAAEAFLNFGSIRQSVERCMAFQRSYRKCADFNVIDVGDPSSSTNSHFNYELSDVSRYGYKIVATRNMHEGGDGLSTIYFEYNNSQIIKSGTGVFKKLH